MTKEGKVELFENKEISKRGQWEGVKYEQSIFYS